MGFASLGVLILWLGWFGFNPGIAPWAADVAGDHRTSSLNTNMAAAAGCLTATATAWIALGKPDLSMMLNGRLAGLVAVTAPCYWIGTGSSVVIGAIAGVLVVYAVLFFDKVKVDDPVGALSVHLVNGVFGTLCVGLFASRNDVAGLFFGGGVTQLLVQLKGVVAVALFTLVSTALLWFVLKLTLGHPRLARGGARGPGQGRARDGGLPGLHPGDVDHPPLIHDRTGGAPWPRRAAPLSRRYQGVNRL